MEKVGTVIEVLPEQSGESRNGGMWRSQDYVIEFDRNSRYPRKMVFTAKNERIDEFKIEKGQTIAVQFDIDAHEWQGRWFNEVRAWRVDSAENK